MYNNPDSSPARRTAFPLQPDREWSVRKPNPDYRLTMEALSDCQCLRDLRGQALFRGTNVFRRPPDLTPHLPERTRDLRSALGRVSAFPPLHLSGGLPRHFRLRGGLEGPGTSQMRSPTTAPGPPRQPAALPAYRRLQSRSGWAASLPLLRDRTRTPSWAVPQWPEGPQRGAGWLAQCLSVWHLPGCTSVLLTSG